MKLLSLKNPWFWFFLLIILYSVYDYYDHISRPDSEFERFPWHWLGFTLFLVASDIIVMFFSNQFLNRILKREKEHLIIQLAAVSIGMLSHLELFGPLADTLFWSGKEGTLTFDSPWAPMALACAIFLTVRFLHFIITKILRMV